MLFYNRRSYPALELTMTKVCSKCAIEKDLSEFNANKQGKDGRRSDCKLCSNASIKKSKAKDPERYAEHKNNWANENPEKRSLSQKNWNDANQDKKTLATARSKAKNPTHQKARQAANNAINWGKLIRPGECSSCLVECTPEAHHPSYLPEHWLDVVFLCKQCHVNTHKETTI